MPSYYGQAAPFRNYWGILVEPVNPCGPFRRIGCYTLEKSKMDEGLIAQIRVKELGQLARNQLDMTDSRM